MCDIDGNQWSIGDDQIEFTLQSSIKPLLYVFQLCGPVSVITSRHEGTPHISACSLTCHTPAIFALAP